MVLYCCIAASNNHSPVHAAAASLRAKRRLHVSSLMHVALPVLASLMMQGGYPRMWPLEALQLRWRHSRSVLAFERQLASPPPPPHRAWLLVVVVAVVDQTGLVGHMQAVLLAAVARMAMERCLQHWYRGCTRASVVM